LGARRFPLTRHGRRATTRLNVLRQALDASRSAPGFRAWPRIGEGGRRKERGRKEGEEEEEEEEEGGRREKKEEGGRGGGRGRREGRTRADACMAGDLL